MTNLAEMSITALPQGSQPMSREDAESYLQQLDGWQLGSDTKHIVKEFAFKNYYRTMAFVNAIAWIAHQTDHHPDLQVGYNRCKVVYSTHSIGGISINDFICAAKIEKAGLI